MSVFLLFIWTRNLDSNLRHEAPNAQAFGRNSPGDCFVASAQSRSYLRNHQNRHQTVSVFYYLFGLEPTSGSPERRKPFWGEEEQWNKRQITFALRINKSGLERYGTCDDEEAPNLASVTSSKFGRNSPVDCFVASAQSRSYLRNQIRYRC